MIVIDLEGLDRLSRLITTGTCSALRLEEALGGCQVDAVALETIPGRKKSLAGSLPIDRIGGVPFSVPLALLLDLPFLCLETEVPPLVTIRETAGTLRLAQIGPHGMLTPRG